MSGQANSYKRAASNSPAETRTLSHLGDTASTSRVLNLSLIYSRCHRDTAYQDYPFFKHSHLNKALIIKHTLRDTERDLFGRARRTATKIILPFDPSDLRLGGRSIFIGQTGYDAFARAYFNSDDPAVHEDLRKLLALDTIPALDPFLVREQMARFGFKPAPCYFQISPSDLTDMTNYANDEVQRLVNSAFNGAYESAAMRLTNKILSNELDSDLDPLRQTFRMDEDEFSEGMFSWRGFLYFKWRQNALQEEIRQVVMGLGQYRTIGRMDEDTRAFLAEIRPRLAKKLIASMADVRQTLNIYDKAYAALTQGSDPGPFRRFLMEGPHMFYDLGEQIGVLSHIATFWTYRLGAGVTQLPLSPGEFAEVLVDFEDSLVKLGLTPKPIAYNPQPQTLV